MPEFGLSESLRESGIEEIRTLGLHIIIKHKNAGSFEIKIKENPFETGKSLLLVQNLIVFITDNWEQIEIKSKSNSEPEPFKPKYQFSTFEEWQRGFLLVLLVHSTRTKSLPTPRSWYASAQTQKQNLGFLLKHFAATDFPRKVSTKTTGGRQVLVNDKPQALARFEQANWLDCRISAYTELDDFPNFLFIDIDTQDQSVLEEILQRFEELNWKPTVLFTGSGHHIYQPVSTIDFSTMSNFNGYSELPKQFLRFVAEYLADNKADVNHYPSLKSCMVRVPGSINSKNGQEVTVMQEWDGNRPDITSLSGIFYSWLATRKILAEKARPDIKFRAHNSSNKINWIEKLLKTPLDDYRKTIVNLVLAPYLANIRRLANKKALEIIKEWLELCRAKRKLDFNIDSLIGNALHNALKSGYKPMRLDTLKQRNPTIYEALKIAS